MSGLALYVVAALMIGAVSNVAKGRLPCAFLLICSQEGTKTEGPKTCTELRGSNT